MLGLWIYQSVFHQDGIHVFGRLTQFPTGAFLLDLKSSGIAGVEVPRVAPLSTPLLTGSLSAKSTLTKICSASWIGFSVKAGGAEGVRTPDLLNAIQALYQLSYDP